MKHILFASAFLFAAALSGQSLNSATEETIRTIRSDWPYLRNLEQRSISNTFLWRSSAFMPGVPVSILLDATENYGGGTIGWAHPLWGGRSYGKIYIYGLNVFPGGIWNGRVYPVNRVIRRPRWVLPCFVLTPEEAVYFSRP